jgi:carbamoyltransferase
MNILGFNAYGHDSAAALLINDKLTYAVEEERLNRKKHAGGFPKLSIQSCLDHGKIDLDAIDHVAFFWKPTVSLIHIPVYALKFWNKLPSLIKEQRNFSVEENLGMLNYIKDMYQLPNRLKKEFTSKQPRFKFHFLEHHLCHAASAFYPSSFEEAAILTIDGAGEWATTLLAKGSGNTISKLKKVNTPYSLGAFYQAISMHLGFKLIEGPGKLMGLASYGNPDTEVYKKMKALFQLKSDGTYSFDTRYFSYYYTRKSGVSKKFTDLFGSSKTEGKNWSEHELNIAAAAQRMVEEVVLHMATYLKKTTRSQNLCMAGGVALNSVTNGILAKSGLFKEIYIQPAAGDSGTAIGSTLLVNHQVLDRQRQPINTAFLGPSYSKERYISALQAAGVEYTDYGKDCYDYIAQQLHANKIVAWFQGNMEFGPRALGNRSILANPGHADMKDILNKRVKFREAFRPFAAIVTEEDCSTFFDHDYPNPYMLLVYNVKPEQRSLLPSITHVDGTVRIQTVNEKENPPMRALLKAFEKRSGFPVLINTSFNIKSEPIVCTPENAIQSFLASDIDFLVLGDLVVAKSVSTLLERKEVEHLQVSQ